MISEVVLVYLITALNLGVSLLATDYDLDSVEATTSLLDNNFDNKQKLKF